jgi:hypothetical protein
MPAGYQLLPWVRRGLAATLTAPDTLKPGLASHARLQAGVLISNIDGPADGQVDLTLHGPGDVGGLDPRLIIRMEPRANSVGFEPNYCAAIEFDSPDLPWMLTPAAPDGQGRLRPWLVLVVVDLALVRPPGMEPDRPLPVLRIASALVPTELPDLDDSWAWAHAQVSSADVAANVDPGTFVAAPHLNLSRIVCPRWLEPDRRYAACLVPAFSVGVQRALGVPPAPDATLGPAWDVRAPADTVLPVYYHWEFSTGAQGNFEALARKLIARKCPVGAGEARMDMTAAGPGLEVPVPAPTLGDFRDGTLGTRGALMTLGLPAQEMADLPDYLPTGLRAHLNAPAAAATGQAAGAPALAPPLYGEWHANEHVLGPGASNWLDQLNADPRHRVSAAIGGEIVRKHQEEFMQSAWEQVGRVIEANRLMSRARLAQEAQQSLYKRHVLALDAARAATFAAPLQARVLGVGGKLTIRAAIRSTSFPDGAMDGAMRRLVSPSNARVKAAVRASRLGVEVARQLAPRLLGSLAAGRADADPRRFSLDGPGGLASAASLPTGAAGAVSLAPLGIPVSVPADAADAIRTAVQQLGTRDFASSPWQLQERTDLATRGAVTQAHLDAFAQAASTAGAAGTADSAARLLAEFVDAAALIGERPALLLPQDGKLALATLAADAGTREVSVTFLKTGVTQRVAQLAPDAAAGRDAGAVQRDLAGLRVLPVGPANAPPTPLARAADGAIEVAGPLAGVARDALHNRLAPRLGQLPPLAGQPPPVAGPAGAAAAAVLGTVIPPLARSVPVATAVQQSMHDYLQLNEQAVSAVPPAVPFDLAAAGDTLRSRMNPATTVPARLGELLRGADGQSLLALDRRKLVEDLGIALSPHADRIMVAPELPAPAYQYLARFDDRWMLPGIAELRDPDLITMVQTNPQFTQAFLTGLNHEMNRELLWRGYPTDRRGTPFRRFWPWSDGRNDIEPIHTFSRASRLGASVAGSAGLVVLLLRGDLLRRYPNTVVYAWKATRKDAKLALADLPATEDGVKDVVREAVFHGRFEPNFSFVGLRLTQAELFTGNEPDGWYIVLQEQPTEPRFGFEASADGPVAGRPATWTNADWSQFGVAPGRHLAIAGNPLAGTTLQDATMGHNGSHLARIMLRMPIRFTIHSSRLTTLHD